MNKINSNNEFADLIKENQAIIHSICKVYFENLEDRKDASQEIVLQLWKSYHSFRGESKISTWMYRVALNTVLNLLKSKQNKPLENDFSNDLDFADTESAVFFEGNDFIQFILNHLSPEDKALMILYLEGYEQAEIAQILALSLSNVSTKINRIKNKLRKIFKPEDYEY